MDSQAVATSGSPEKFMMTLMQNGEEVTGTYTVSVVTQISRNSSTEESFAVNEARWRPRRV